MLLSMLLATQGIAGPPRTATSSHAVQRPAPRPAPRPARVAPRRAVVVVPVVDWWGWGVVPPVSDTPAPVRPAPLPFVPAAPLRTSIEETGTFVPIEELPSAFVPLREAENLLPVTQIRPKQ